MKTLKDIFLVIFFLGHSFLAFTASTSDFFEKRYHQEIRENFVAFMMASTQGEVYEGFEFIGENGIKLDFEKWILSSHGEKDLKKSFHLDRDLSIEDLIVAFMAINFQGKPSSTNPFISICKEEGIRLDFDQWILSSRGEKDLKKSFHLDQDLSVQDRTVQLFEYLSNEDSRIASTGAFVEESEDTKESAAALSKDRKKEGKPKKKAKKSRSKKVKGLDSKEECLEAKKNFDLEANKHHLNLYTLQFLQLIKKMETWFLSPRKTKFRQTCSKFLKDLEELKSILERIILDLEEHKVSRENYILDKQRKVDLINLMTVAEDPVTGKAKVTLAYIHEEISINGLDPFVLVQLEELLTHIYGIDEKELF